MRLNKHSFPSTESMPFFYDKNYNSYDKRINSFYLNMFLDDFCSNFYINLCDNPYSSRDFFTFNGNIDKFNDIFCYDFLTHKFNKLLSNIAKNMILYGKAYVAKEIVYDNNQNINQINYRCINCKKIRNRHKHLVYKFVNSLNNKKEQGIIDKNICLFFDIKKAKLDEKRIINKIIKLDKYHNTTNLFKYNCFDFNHFKNKEEAKQLLLTKKIYWSCRNSGNYYLSEPYLLYRQIYFYIMQEKLLGYLVSVFNADLRFLKLKGTITYNSKVRNYGKLLDDLYSGKKNCQEVCDIIFKHI